MAAALAGVGLHHKATQGPASVLDQLIHGEHTDSRWRELADLVEAVDKICSAATVIGAAEEADRKFGHGLPQRKFDVTFHRVQMLRGVSTTFLHRACLDAHIESAGKGDRLVFEFGETQWDGERKLLRGKRDPRPPESFRCGCGVWTK